VPHAPLIVVNPIAGGGRARRLVGWLEDRLRFRPGATLRVTTRAGEAEELAAAAARAGHDRVIAVGGDGTVQEVVNGLLTAGAQAVELGVLPVGTGNDLARSLGLPRDAEGAWARAIGPQLRAMDVGLARNGEQRERWFASAAGVGFDAQVAAAMARRRGWQASRAGYLATTLLELRRFHNRRVRIRLDGTEHHADVLFVAIANGAFYGGGMHIAPGAQPDDGHLDICIVGDITRRTALRQLPNLYGGTHVRHPAVSIHACRELLIEDGDGSTAIHLDGEPFGTLPLAVTLHPAALRIAAPA
jgi:diacylglycerol kinase (ATP)